MWTDLEVTSVHHVEGTAASEEMTVLVRRLKFPWLRALGAQEEVVEKHYFMSGSHTWYEVKSEDLQWIQDEKLVTTLNLLRKQYRRSRHTQGSC